MSRTRPYYKRYQSDFLAGAQGLGPAAIGCYNMVIDAIYDRDGSCPNDMRWLGGLMGCSSRMARSLVDALLTKGKLYLDDDGNLRNHRADIELQLAQSESKTAAENGAKGGQKSVQTRSKPSRKPRELAANAQRTTHERTSTSNKNNNLAQATLNHIIDIDRYNGIEGGSAAPTSDTAEHDFKIWVKACARTIPKGWSQPATLKRWRTLPPNIKTEHLIEAWHAYVADNREQSKNSRYPKKTRYPESWIKDRVYESYLDDIQQHAHDDAERNEAFNRTVTAWNGKAQPVIAAIGIEKFRAYLSNSTIAFPSPEHATITVQSAFTASRLEATGPVMRALAAALNAEITVAHPKPQRRSS